MAQFKIKRRDARVDVVAPVMLTVTDGKGHPQEQEVKTIDISCWGRRCGVPGNGAEGKDRLAVTEG